VTGPQGITFTGFIAAVTHQNHIIPESALDSDALTQPELALDSGTLTQPDGRVLKGDFSIAFPEGTILSYSQIPVGAQFSFTLSPHIFRGTISSGMTIDPLLSANAQVWAVENLLKDQKVTDVIHYE
jgi:hypothetical protein